ncbi:hypothetical protein HOC32_00020 [Candidatus Woesearchaeota archaeon]|jgi:hypothetical protein|nr:hypothetical protein [Candidatus Woesearchaeota archaeon]
MEISDVLSEERGKAERAARVPTNFGGGVSPNWEILKETYSALMNVSRDSDPNVAFAKELYDASQIQRKREGEDSAAAMNQTSHSIYLLALTIERNSR